MVLESGDVSTDTCNGGYCTGLRETTLHAESLHVSVNVEKKLSPSRPREHLLPALHISPHNMPVSVLLNCILK